MKITTSKAYQIIDVGHAKAFLRTWIFKILKIIDIDFQGHLIGQIWF